MDVNKYEPIQWGKHPESCVQVDYRQTDVIRMTGNVKDAATGILHYPDVWMTVMTRAQAKKLGATLIRASNAPE